MKEKLIKLLGLDAEATDDQIVEALSSKLDNSKLLKALDLKEDASADDMVAAIEKLGADDTEVSLEDKAKAEGKVVVDASEWTETKANAAAGKAAAAELKQDKFDRAFDKALEELRVDAKDETRTEWQELYDLAPEQTIKRLDALPKVANAKPRGSGEGPAADAPDNVDQERFELNEKVEARMAKDDCSYEEALRKVRAEEKS
jgi:hypothetical protein